MAKRIDKYVMAVKNFKTAGPAMASGKKFMPKEASVYKDFFENVAAECSELDGMKKFIKKTKLPKKECMHYWEGLITLDFTLLLIDHVTDDENFVENACDNEDLKFISRIR